MDDVVNQEIIWGMPLELGGVGEVDDDDVYESCDVDSGKEYRLLMVGTKKDGRLFVRQFTRGEDTQFAFNCDVHSQTIVFKASDGYGLTEIGNKIEEIGSEEDVFITDFQDDLATIGIPYELREWSQVLEVSSK